MAEERLPMLCSLDHFADLAKRRLLARIAWLFLLVVPGGCASSRANDPDIVSPDPGAPELESIPGPMLGPFNSSSDAVIAACNTAVRKPNATAGRRNQQNFHTYWRVAIEYCAWIYYTPDDKYFVSKLTDQSKPDPTNKVKNCFLPWDVDDSRYAGRLQYIVAVHTHPSDNGMSLGDISYTMDLAKRHGHESYTKDGTIPLSAIAFFSNSIVDPSCDGFHQYIPATNQILKWTRSRSGWHCEQTGQVIWKGQNPISINKVAGPCKASGAS